MSKQITLQADLVIAPSPSRNLMSIPSGTIVTFTEADTFDHVAEILASISPTVLAQNRSQLDRTIVASGIRGITDGNDVLVSYGPRGERVYHDFAASSSPSGSPSSSVSASTSASPSSSVSSSRSASISSSRSASPSAS